MYIHPASRSVAHKVRFFISVLAAMAGLWVLLAVYGRLSLGIALVDSAIYILLLSCAGYLYWYVARTLSGFVQRAVVAIAVQVVCVGVAFAVMVISGLSDAVHYSHTVLLHFVYGTLLWTVLYGWYRIVGLNDAAEDAPAVKAPESASKKRSESSQRVETNSSKAELFDRISIKNGSRIEIIPVHKITYIQAYGDYVMLHTDSERHIKEQTMKFYETSLPDTFVRIHRSFIVNTDNIARVELAGKENHTVKLKNGVAIRASAAGYKALKERLSL